jgi:DNA-binding CsgD family transcriptional regulator
MRIAPFAHVSAADAPRTQRHPWLHALELFAVPFVCYSPDGRRIDVSQFARQFADATPDGATLFAQVDRIVADELQRSQSCLRFGRLALVRQSPSCFQTATLSVYIARPSLDGVAAVVTMGVYAPASEPGRLTGLTPRESEIAQLIASGLPTKTIAASLDISSHTTRHHIERLYKKLGVHTRAGIASLVRSRIGTSAQMR